MENFWNHPPRYLDNNIDPSWILEVVGGGDASAEVTCSPLTDVGGMMSTMFKIIVVSHGVSKTYILKQIVSESQRQTSRNLGLAREAYFYKHELRDQIGHKLLPVCVYSFADESIGSKFVMLEDVGKALPTGFFYGPGNPNNWKKASQLNELCAPYLEKGITVESVTKDAFIQAARIHAKFWKKSDVLSIPWLRGRHWWIQEGVDEWNLSQKSCSDAWAKKLESDPHGGIKDDYLFELVDASVKKINLSEYQEWSKKTHWTLVHGDFHPANLMWVDELNSSKFLDWEMIGIGSGPQEIGQYLISHMDIEKRRECEGELLRAYYDELIANGVSESEFSYDNCLEDYVRGGSERWTWFLAYLSLPEVVTNYFSNQVIAFCKDHKVTTQNIGQVRP